MSKSRKTLSSVIMALVMFVAIFATMPHLHAVEPVSVEIPFTKNIAYNSPVPTEETFRFKISAYTGATGDSAQVTPAPIPANPYATFSKSISGVGNSAVDGKLYTGLIFTPGRYYYDISEVAGTNQDYSYDINKYIVCIEAKYVGGVLTATPVAIWMNQIVNTTEAKKSEIVFNNSYNVPTGTLTLSKTVTGELANLDLPFEFTVTFTDSTYDFDTHGYGNITDGTGTITLKHGQSVTFTNILLNTGYTITEKDATAYTTTISNNGTTVNDKTATGTVGRSATVTVAYTNDLPYDPVVGLNIDSIPYVLLGAFALIGICLVLIKKREYRGR